MPITYYFKDWFFNKLPAYFTNNDSYQDANGEGLLKRYLRNYGMELDEEFKPYIDNFLDLFDAAICETTLLPHLSFILGLPISLDNTEATYRKVLKYAIRLYKIKGTAGSYKMLFNFIGLDITILEDIPPPPVIYDANPIFIYDDPTGVKKYDTGCAACSGYSIAYNSFVDPTNVASVPGALLALAQNIICFLQPINATFDGFVKRLNITEPFPIDIEESSTITAFLQEPGEFSEDFDITNEFD